jgi:hypothetical protein
VIIQRKEDIVTFSIKLGNALLFVLLVIFGLILGCKDQNSNQTTLDSNPRNIALFDEIYTCPDENFCPICDDSDAFRQYFSILFREPICFEASKTLESYFEEHKSCEPYDVELLEGFVSTLGGQLIEHSDSTYLPTNPCTTTIWYDKNGNIRKKTIHHCEFRC